MSNLYECLTENVQLIKMKIHEVCDVNLMQLKSDITLHIVCVITKH
jgi:hypothetical protein